MVWLLGGGKDGFIFKKQQPTGEDILPAIMENGTVGTYRKKGLVLSERLGCLTGFHKGGVNLWLGFEG